MSFFINEIQNLRAQVSALKADKERLENKYATTVELGLLTCTVAKLATEQAKEWEFRANAAKEIIGILCEHYNVSDEDYLLLVEDVLYRKADA